MKPNHFKHSATSFIRLNWDKRWFELSKHSAYRTLYSDNEIHKVSYVEIVCYQRTTLRKKPYLLHTAILWSNQLLQTIEHIDKHLPLVVFNESLPDMYENTKIQYRNVQYCSNNQYCTTNIVQYNRFNRRASFFINNNENELHTCLTQQIYYDINYWLTAIYWKKPSIPGSWFLELVEQMTNMLLKKLM